MKLKTRLMVAFLTVTVVPMLLIFMAFMGLSSYQTGEIRKNYGLTEPVDILPANSMQIFSRLTESSQEEIREMIDEDPGAFEDRDYLDQLNEETLGKYAYTIVRKGEQIIYEGNPQDSREISPDELPSYGNGTESFEGGIYLDGDSQHLLKQIDFRFPDGEEGSLFLVSNVDELIPEVESMIREMLISGVLILCFTGAALTTWVYRSIWRPLGQLQQATKNIRDGNLDFTLEVEDEDDELGRLCQDFEEMRIRLKESAEEKVQYDKESKELISNISHDLKTPITAIKGYVEGIMDGVASSPEKLDKYIRTIYNKANDMDRLIDELTFYSKIDTNKIPYTFSKINVAEYFGDCVEEVGLDLEARGIELGYFNYVDRDVMIIADAEQILNGVPPERRNAEWYFLKGSVLYRRGWLEEAKDHFSRACQMDPGNPEYSAALNQAMNQGSGVYGGYRPNANMNAGGCNSCDVCSSLICADCCCECMGGDLISCC